MNTMQLHQTVRRLTDGESVTVTARGDCMVPWIENGAGVQVTPARFYWPGDVVVVLSGNNQYLIHRVIGLYRRSGKVKILTQADTALRPDGAVDSDDVLGRVSGGCCHACAVSVPFVHRLKASARFIRFIIAFFVKKYSG
jgi:phage repressor protein C with HTH and peptisase S24 domain